MTEEVLSRGMGFNEKYFDGPELRALLKYGDVYPETYAYYEDNDIDPVEWDVVFSSRIFKKKRTDELVVYAFYDRNMDPVCAIAQYP